MQNTLNYRSNRRNLTEGMSAKEAYRFNAAIAGLLKVNGVAGTPAHWSAESVPTAFLPAINEVTAAQGFPRFHAKLKPLELSPLAKVTENEALSHIAAFPSTLVTTSTHTDPTKLIRRICRSFPTARIVVLASSDAQGIKLVAALRQDGVSSWYFKGEYRKSPDGTLPCDRVRVAKDNRLSIASLELHNADIVVVTDTTRFVHNDYFGHHSGLFDLQLGTHFQSGVRLVGLVPANAAMADMRLVMPVFGLRTFQLGPNGHASITPLVTWASRTKNDRSDHRIGLDQRLCNQKRVLVWENQNRNSFIVRRVREARALAEQYPFVQSRYGGEIENAVAVIVENEIHKRAVGEVLLSKGLSSDILTFDDIRTNAELPSIMVRADAGVGLLPIPVQKWPVNIVDVLDRSPKLLRHNATKRQKAYLASWHVGDKPLAAKLLSLKHLRSK